MRHSRPGLFAIELDAICGGGQLSQCQQQQWRSTEIGVVPSTFRHQFALWNERNFNCSRGRNNCLFPFVFLKFINENNFKWDLICENEFWRTSTQVAVSFGKFVGASAFGVFSDKFGRKNAFTLGATFYTIGSLLDSFSPWYWPFFIGRMMLGSASSGLFYPALTICKSFLFILLTNLFTFLAAFIVTENIGSVHRSWMSIAFTISYPIGLILLALSAHFIHEWRMLQLSLTIPSVMLVVIWL